MAVKKSELDPNILLEIQKLADKAEIEIDKRIRKTWRGEGSYVAISFIGELVRDWHYAMRDRIFEELAKRYKDAGWTFVISKDSDSEPYVTIK